MNELFTALLFGALVAAITYYVLVRPLKMQIDRLLKLLTILSAQREKLVMLLDQLEPDQKTTHRRFVVKIYEEGIRNFGIIDHNLSPDVLGVVSGKTPMPLPEES